MSKIISNLGDFFSRERASLSWGKKRGKSALNFGLGAWGEYKKLKFHAWNSDVNKRIDKTYQCYINAIKRNIMDGAKTCEIPSFLHRLKVEKSNDGESPQIISQSRKYKLEQNKINNAPVIDDKDNKLHKIVKLNHKISGVKEGKATKTYSIWIDRNNDISSLNVAGQKQTYNFSGKVGAFSAIDRNVNTGEKNWLTTLFINWPLGLCAYLIKAIGYRVPDIIFDKIPKALDRAIVPLVSAIIFWSIYAIGNIGIFLFCDIPQKIIQKFKPDFNLYEKFSKPFDKALDFNKNIIKNGVTVWLKADILDENDAITKYKALKAGTFTSKNSKEENAIKNKYYTLKVIGGFSHALNTANLGISNFANVIASGLKGVANSILCITHFDKAYLESAKFLFTEPLKITRDEFKQEFEITETIKTDRFRSTSESSITNNNSYSAADQNYLNNARDSGRALRSSGVKRQEEATTTSYNTADTRHESFSGKKLNISAMPT